MDIFFEILKNNSLETRLKVSNEMAFISLLTELGFREDKSWSPEEDELLGKLCQFAYKHTQNQLETIKQWQNDGASKFNNEK